MKLANYFETKQKINKKQLKEKAQDIIMHALGNARGYWKESYNLKEFSVEEINEIDKQLKILCDKIAKSYKFDKSWIN